LSSRALTLDDAGWVTPAARAALSPLSECAFANLYLFREAHQYRVAEGPWPHLLGRTYDGEETATPLFDLAAAPVEAVREILGEGRRIYPVDEVRASALGELYEGGWSDADSDYVYDAARLRTLAGLKDRLSQAERFAAEAEPRIEPIESAAALRAAYRVLDLWLEESAKPWAATDYAACCEALDLREALGLFGLMVFAGRAPVGFVLASALNDDMAAVHFAKGLRSPVGIYPFMFRAFARWKTNLLWVNFEQDLGHPGFRQAKRSYRPVRMQRKFRLAPRRQGAK
jgi:hypothetical protein